MVLVMKRVKKKFALLSGGGVTRSRNGGVSAFGNTMEVRNEDAVSVVF